MELHKIFHFHFPFTNIFGEKSWVQSQSSAREHTVAMNKLTQVFGTEVTFRESLSSLEKGWKMFWLTWEIPSRPVFYT